MTAELMTPQAGLAEAESEATQEAIKAIQLQMANMMDGMALAGDPNYQEFQKLVGSFTSATMMMGNFKG